MRPSEVPLHSGACFSYRDLETQRRPKPIARSQNKTWRRSSSGFWPLTFKFSLVLAFLPMVLRGQPTADQLARILERLDVLEQQNRSLLSEIQALREQVSKAGAPLTLTVPPAETSATAAEAPTPERLGVAEQEIRDLAQSKVESDHRSPVQLTGMVLFNTYRNGLHAEESQYPTTASVETDPRGSGASLRQTIIGLKFQSPEKIAGMDVSGSAYMDFFGGTGTALGQMIRLRVASVNFGWRNTTFTVGQDKPILSPREPDSLAQVGVSPLTGAGNLWLWSPQARVEQRFHFGETAGLRAQIGVYQTGESPQVYAQEGGETVSGSRPALQGRFVFWKQAGSDSRFEIAPGFHVSDSHIGGTVVPSRIASIDWSVPMGRHFSLTGQLFHGENMGVIGGLRHAQSKDEIPYAVRGSGGWAQLKYQATSRLAFNLFTGQENDLRRDVDNGQIAKNQNYGANMIYRIMSNVLTSFEWSYVRSTYIDFGDRINRHYDLAFAYLF